MTLTAITGNAIPSDVLYQYLQNLVNMYFKILPMKENGEKTLLAYMKNLRADLVGCRRLFEVLHDDPMFLSMINILQYLIDTPECDVEDIRRNVFNAISLCNKLSKLYAEVDEQ